MFETKCHPIENAIQVFDKKSTVQRKRLLQMMYSQIEPDLTKIATDNKTDGLNCNLTRKVFIIFPKCSLLFFKKCFQSCFLFF